MTRQFYSGVGVLTTSALLITLPAAPAAQAKGSADAGAAKRVNPHWKAPRNAFGQPDLEGIWTTDDKKELR